jgi:hypothetical protein
METKQENSIKAEDELEFAIFCIENIALCLDMAPEKIYELLAQKSNILQNYIIANFDTLHTQGKEYIVNDIIEVMKEKGVL